MSGERDLSQLLSSLKLAISEEVYVFITRQSADLPAHIKAKMMFVEQEGVTYIITHADALAHGLAYEYESRAITLDVHSSLEAVGFMAVIATKLADAGISVNPVAGFYHDHLFVPSDKVDEAIAVLSHPA